MTTVVAGEQKVELVSLGDSVIKECAWYADALRVFEDGLLVARGNSWRRDWNEPDPGPWWQASEDAGATWMPYAVHGDGRDHTQAAVPFLCLRRDGSVIGWAGAWNAETEYQGRPGQPVAQSVVRAAGWDALVRGHG